MGSQSVLQVIRTPIPETGPGQLTRARLLPDPSLNPKRQSTQADASGQPFAKEQGLTTEPGIAARQPSGLLHGGKGLTYTPLGEGAGTAAAI